ncbi:MAG: hypothetical protein MUF54_06020 [Polyangiaceae bacterium]|nr:hypothetical protein [Polyangiaceae bacterium]
MRCAARVAAMPRALVVWGEPDPAHGCCVVDGTRRRAQHLRVHRLRNAGHFVHRERPDAVNSLLLRALREPAG